MEDNKEDKEPRKRGAKRKTDDGRTKVLRARVTEIEYNSVESKRGLTNIDSMSEFVRSVMLNYENRLKEPPKNIVDFKAQLRSIGININQIARSLNSKQASFLNTDDIKNSIGDANSKLKEILVLLKKHYS